MDMTRHLTKRQAVPYAADEVSPVSNTLDWLAKEARDLLARSDDGRVLGEAKVRLERKGDALTIAGEDPDVLKGILGNICVVDKVGQVLAVVYRCDLEVDTYSLCAGDTLRMDLVFREEST